MEETPKALSNGSAKGDSAEVRGGDDDDNNDEDDNENYVRSLDYIWSKWSITPERIVRWGTIKHIRNRLGKGYLLVKTN